MFIERSNLLVVIGTFSSCLRVFSGLYLVDSKTMRCGDRMSPRQAPAEGVPDECNQYHAEPHY